MIIGYHLLCFERRNVQYAVHDATIDGGKVRVEEGSGGDSGTFGAGVDPWALNLWKYTDVLTYNIIS
jgi:hypothetical protein